MKVKLSDLKEGDLILVRGMFLGFPFNLITRYFTKGFRHSALYYGQNERGGGLVLECIARCGPAISPINRYLGDEIEVWRIDHHCAAIFVRAILKAGEEVLTKKWAFFDWPLILFRATLVKLGFSGRINHRYYPLWFCSDFVQTECFEKAIKYLNKTIAPGYKRDILAHIPHWVMVPIEFRSLPFLKKVKEGKFIG
jgi:hypothetical protein